MVMKAVRGDEENIGVQFNFCIIDFSKRKELGPNTICITFLLTLISGISEDPSVNSRRDSFKGCPMAL